MENRRWKTEVMEYVEVKQKVRIMVTRTNKNGM